MNAYATHQFEVEKNRKAFLYTLVVCAAFLLIAVFYTWKSTRPPVPDTMDLIQVNLGNEMEGLGDIQPLVPGDPAPDDQSISAAVSGKKSDEVPSRQIQADDNADPDAAPVVKTEHPSKTAPEINRNSTFKSTKSVNPSPIVNPNPAPPRPKTIYKGGNGTGGNGAETDNGFRNQGYKGGNGDMGSPNGNPDSYGNSQAGRSGFSVVRGLSGRRAVHFPNMTDNFNENAKVYVDIVVTPSGKVINPSIARGTTTTNSRLRSIAIEKAESLKFNPTSTGNNETGTILFNFVLKN